MEFVGVYTCGIDDKRSMITDFRALAIELAITYCINTISAVFRMDIGDFRQEMKIHAVDICIFSQCGG